MTTVNCTYLDQSVEELLEHLSAPASNSLSSDPTMCQLGRKLGENILDLINNKFIGNGYKKVYIATTVEDADYLAQGILKVIDEKISNVGFACFWNHRFAPSGIKELMVAPIIKEYMEPVCDHIDYLIVATSVISDDCVLRTNLTYLVEKINPFHIIIASPVIVQGAEESLKSELEEEIFNKFEFLYFTQKSNEEESQRNYISGIIAKFYQCLESVDQDEKNTSIPQIVKKRRDGYVIAHKAFRQPDAFKVIPNKVYDNLKEKGLPRKYVDSVIMPSWWNSDVEITPSNFVNLAHSLSRRLSLDVESILKLDMPLEFSIPNPKFKKNKNTKTDQLKLASSLNWRLVQIVGSSISEPYIPMPDTSLQIREEILAKYSSINLHNLIKYCWEHYLPVAHFNKFPKNTCKPDGIASNFHDRPVIIIGSALKSYSRLLFILAHELGHIVLGHVKNEMLLDENLQTQELDDEEKQANRFAVELLFGKDDPYEWKEKLGYTKLKCISQDFSRKDRVAQGAVLLNYAYHTKDWKKVSDLLKKVEPELNAPEVINNFLKENLRSESLSDDASDYLHRIEVLAA